MIKSQEIRIGNWIKTASHDFQVDAKFIFELSELEKKNFKGSYQYIELSEEWLIKFGFEKRKMPFTGIEGFAIIGDKYFIGLTPNPRKDWSFSNPHFDLRIDYVHQLQNLYYCLTGTELDLK